MDSSKRPTGAHEQQNATLTSVLLLVGIQRVLLQQQQQQPGLPAAEARPQQLLPLSNISAIPQLAAPFQGSAEAPLVVILILVVQMLQKIREDLQQQQQPQPQDHSFNQIQGHVSQPTHIALQGGQQQPTRVGSAAEGFRGETDISVISSISWDATVAAVAPKQLLSSDPGPKLCGAIGKATTPAITKPAQPGLIGALQQHLKILHQREHDTRNNDRRANKKRTTRKRKRSQEPSIPNRLAGIPKYIQFQSRRATTTKTSMPSLPAGDRFYPMSKDAVIRHEVQPHLPPLPQPSSLSALSAAARMEHTLPTCYQVPPEEAKELASLPPVAMAISSSGYPPQQDKLLQDQQEYCVAPVSSRRQQGRYNHGQMRFLPPKQHLQVRPHRRQHGDDPSARKLPEASENGESSGCTSPFSLGTGSSSSS